MYQDKGSRISSLYIFDVFDSRSLQYILGDKPHMDRRDILVNMYILRYCILHSVHMVTDYIGQRVYL